MAAGDCRDGRCEAAVSHARMDCPHSGRRTPRHPDDASAGRLECQGQARTWMAAGTPVMASGICRRVAATAAAQECSMRRSIPLIIRAGLDDERQDARRHADLRWGELATREEALRLYT